MNLSDYATLYVQHRDGSPGYLDQLYSAISAIERFTGRPLELEDLTETLVNAAKRDGHEERFHVLREATDESCLFIKNT